MKMIYYIAILNLFIYLPSARGFEFENISLEKIRNADSAKKIEEETTAIDQFMQSAEFSGDNFSDKNKLIIRKINLVAEVLIKSIHGEIKYKGYNIARQLFDEGLLDDHIVSSSFDSMDDTQLRLKNLFESKIENSYEFLFLVERFLLIMEINARRISDHINKPRQQNLCEQGGSGSAPRL